ncbi:MAG TPA: YdcF family protein [Candidatus Sulfotelmatobacter sp.]|nr:YdcF family protein [Candidatus Sulfotelmatobacter sp.]
MIRLLWKLCRLLVAVLIVAVAVYFGGPALLTGLGRYLVTSQPLVASDLAVVLSGEPFLRVPEAARLYHDGVVRSILITNELRPPGLDDLRRIGIRFPDTQEISLEILAALKVPVEAVQVIHEASVSTGEEAGIVARFLKAHPVGSVILVTSKSHTTRSDRIFRSQLPAEVRVIMHAVSSDPFNPDAWWRDRGQAKQVLYEYEGLIDFWRGQLWGMMRGGAEPPLVVTVR